MTLPTTPPAEVPISGKVVDADGNGLAGVKVSLENGTSVMTGGDGRFSIMASQGVHTLTFSGDKIKKMIEEVTADGMGADLKSVTVALHDAGGDNATAAGSHRGHHSGGDRRSDNLCLHKEVSCQNQRPKNEDAKLLHSLFWPPRAGHWIALVWSRFSLVLLP